MSQRARYHVIEDARISEESSNTVFSAKNILFQDNERDERSDARWLTSVTGDEESYFVVDLLETTQVLGVNFRQGSNGTKLSHGTKHFKLEFSKDGRTWVKMYGPTDGHISTQLTERRSAYSLLDETKINVPTYVRHVFCGRYIKFTAISCYGQGAALSEFSVLVEPNQLEERMKLQILNIPDEKFNIASKRYESREGRREDAEEAIKALENEVEPAILKLENIVHRVQLMLAEKRKEVEKKRKELNHIPKLKGLVNAGVTCYLNISLQAFFMTPELRCGLYRWRYQQERDGPREMSIPYQLQKLFIRMQTAETKCVDTEGLRKAFGWTGGEHIAQHEDSEEFITKVLAKLEEVFKTSEVAGIVPALYGGTHKRFTRCMNCSVESPVEEPATPYFLNVQVKCGHNHYTSLEDALAGNFGEAAQETLDGDNQYFCETCEQKQDAVKGAEIKKAAYIQAIKINRVDYDMFTGQNKKVHAKMSFPFELDLAPYVSPSTLELSGQETPQDEFLEVSSCPQDDNQAPAQVNFGHNGLPTLQRGYSIIDKQYPYELFAIHVHKGPSADFGHYYTYVKDVETGHWYEINDRLVTGPITEEEVKKATYGGEYFDYHERIYTSITAQMLFYRRKSDANIMAIDNRLIPQCVLEEIATDERNRREREEREAADKERKRDAKNFFVIHEDRATVIYAKNSKTWGIIKQEICTELELDVAAEKVDFSILKQNATGRYTGCASRPRPIQFRDNMPIRDVASDILTGKLILVRKVHTAIPVTAQTVPGEEIAHIYFSGVDETLDIKHHAEVKVGSTLKDVKTAIANALSIDESKKFIVLKDTCQGNNIGTLKVTYVEDAKDASFETVSEAVINSVLSGSQPVSVQSMLKHLKPSGKSKKAKIHLYGKELVIYNFSSLKVEVTSSFGQRLKMLQPRGYRPKDAYHEEECELPSVVLKNESTDALNFTYTLNDDDLQVIVVTDDAAVKEEYNTFQVSVRPLSSYMTVDPCRANPGVFTLPCYLFCGRTDDFGEYRFDLKVDQRWSVVELKVQMKAKMQEENFPMPEHIRVIEMRSEIVLEDSKTVGWALGGLLDGKEMLSYSELSNPESCTSEFILLNTFQYFPLTFSTAGPGEQIPVLLPKSTARVHSNGKRGYDMTSRKVTKRAEASAVKPVGDSKPTCEYTVKPGDTLYELARKFQTYSTILYAFNAHQMPDEHTLKVGQTLILPSETLLPGTQVIWEGSTWTIEMGVDEDNEFYYVSQPSSVLSIERLMSEAFGIPEEFISIAWSRLGPRGSIADQVPTGTALDMEGLYWSTGLPCFIFEEALKCIEVFYVKDKRHTELDLTAEEKRARARAETINMTKRRSDGRPAMIGGINLGQTSHVKNSESTGVSREGSNCSIGEANRILCERLKKEEEDEHQRELDILMENRNFSNGTVDSNDGSVMGVD